MFAAIAFAALALTARAAVEPTVVLDDAAGQASDIVVVSQDASLDGRCTVFETWKGQLKRGDVLTIPGLKDFVPENSRLIYYGAGSPGAGEPSRVSGTRLALFLRRSSSPAQTWEHVGPGEMMGSVVWFDQDHAFAFAQEKNPGPVLIRRLQFHLVSGGGTGGVSEADVKSRVLDEVGAQGALVKAQGIADPAQRVEAFKLLVTSKYERVRTAAEEGLKAAATAAIAPTSPAVNDPQAPILPVISLDAASLDAAIRSLAIQAKISVQLDPKLSDRPVGPDQVAIAKRPVTFRWENISAKQALARLLDENGLLMLPGPTGKPARIVTKEQAAAGSARKPGE